VVDKLGLSIIKVDDGWMVGIFEGYTNDGGAIDGTLGSN
jgi:hypothetical protein